MSAIVGGLRTQGASHGREHMTEPLWVRGVLTTLALSFLFLVVVLPLLTVFSSALGKGLGFAWAVLVNEDTGAAIRLTLLTAAIAVPANVVFGLMAGWLLSRYSFPGRNLLVTLIDLPFSVSPVISGLIFVLLFGAHGVLGPWLQQHDLEVIYAVPGIVIATAFVTFPLVAREVLGVMEAQGHDEEEAAFTLGATGWQIFFRITLPKLKWGLLYGVVLCNARAMGEFGAVSVVSGHIRGETTTMPLHVEMLYNEFNFEGAFAVASLLALLALATLLLKQFVSHLSSRSNDENRAPNTPSPSPLPTESSSAT